MNSPDLLIPNSQRFITQFALLAGMGTLAVLFILRTAIIFSYDPEITGVDNNFVLTVLRMLAGFSPYPDPERFPYIGNIYSPLYFDVCFLIGKLTGVNPDIPIQVFRLCRSVSLAADAITTSLLYIILDKNFRLPKAWAIFGTAFFATILCFLAYTFNRVDSLFLTFYTMVFWLLTNPSLKVTGNFILLLAFLCTCAIFTKQNGVILPVLVVGWLFLCNERKRILHFLVAIVAMFAATYFFYTYIVGYRYLAAYTFNGIKNQVDPQWFYRFVFKPMANSVLLLPLGIGITLALNYLIFSKFEGRHKGIAAAFLIQTGFSTGAAFKWGSSLGYYNESFVLAFICMAIFCYTKRENLNLQISFVGLLLPVYLVFAINVFLQNYLFFVGRQPAKKAYYQKQVAVKNYIQPLLNGKHVIDMYIPNRDFFKHLMYREMAVPHFDTIDCCLLPDGTFDYTRLKQEFATGTIQFIIFPKNAPLSEIWGVPLNRYVKDTTLFDYDIYRYR